MEYYDQSRMDMFLKWCDRATKDILWLNLNKNIEKFFYNELDYCIASDFNFIIGNGRTEIGEAEYQIKYNYRNINDEDKKKFEQIIMKKDVK